MNKLFFCIIASLLTLSLSSCHLMSNKGSPLRDLAARSKELEHYRVRGGDTLDIQVWGEPSVSGIVNVRHDGRFTLALVGEIFAAGKGLDQLAHEVETSLSEFIQSASVIISVRERAPLAYYLSGSFQNPGEFRSDKNIKLLQAVATGGGFAPFANESKITIIRPHLDGSGDARYYLNYNKVVNGTQPNPILQDGDTITVE